MNYTVLILVSILLPIGSITGIFFAIKYFIKYNADVNRNRTQVQEELDKMKIDDL